MEWFLQQQTKKVIECLIGTDFIISLFTSLYFVRYDAACFSACWQLSWSRDIIAKMPFAFCLFYFTYLFLILYFLITRLCSATNINSTVSCYLFLRLSLFRNAGSAALCFSALCFTRRDNRPEISKLKLNRFSGPTRN